MTMHFGRAFTGHEIEDNCPCPQEPCGLVNLDKAAPECEHHPLRRAKTMRQIHPAHMCKPSERGETEHRVSVVDGAITSFTCTNPQAECHVYPECECESWSKDHGETEGPGHGVVWHEDCWLKDWFEADGTAYIGEDCNDARDNGLPHNLTFAGVIECEFEDGPLWSFVELPA